MDWKFKVTYIFIVTIFSVPEYLIDALLKFPSMLSNVFHHERKCKIKFTDLNKICDCTLCCVLIHCTIRIFLRRSAAASLVGISGSNPAGGMNAFLL